MRLQIQHFQFGALEFRTVILRPAIGGYVLGIIVHARLEPMRNAVKHAFWDPRLLVDVKRADDVLRLGIAYPWSLTQLEQYDHTVEQDIHFEMPLSTLQVAQLERIRNGGEITLQFWLQAHGRRGDRSDSVLADGHAQITQKNWLEQLRTVGAADVLLVEIPLPADDRHSAARHLRRARDLYLQGHFDDSVANCRKALEALAKSLADAKDLRLLEASTAIKEERERFTVKERIGAIRNAVYQATNLANHSTPADQSDYAFDQASAHLVVTSTAALLGYCSRLPPK